MERADRAARAYDPRIEKVVVTLGDETKHVRIANSAGLLVEDVQPLFSIRVSAIAREGGIRREGFAGGGGRLGPEFFDTKPPEHFAREAARMAVTLLGAVEAPAGSMPVVLAPGWPGILRDPFWLWVWAAGCSGGRSILEIPAVSFRIQPGSTSRLGRGKKACSWPECSGPPSAGGG